MKSELKVSVNQFFNMLEALEVQETLVINGEEKEHYYIYVDSLKEFLSPFEYLEFFKEDKNG